MMRVRYAHNRLDGARRPGYPHVCQQESREPARGCRLAAEGKTCLLVTSQLAGIAAKELGPPIANHSHDRQASIAELNLLFTGI